MTPDPDGALPPDFALLANWLEGRLDPAVAAQVAAAVEHGSPELRESTAWVRTFLQQADSDPLPAPPPLVRQRLDQGYHDWLEGARGRRPARVPAVLAFDSRVERSSAAVRGRQGGNTIHLAYRAEPAELVLDVRMLGHGYAGVEGQVFPSAETRATIFEAVATGPEVTIRVVDGDRLGRFRMTPVPLDRYDLSVSNGEFTMTAVVDLRTR